MIEADPALVALLNASPEDGHGERKLVWLVARRRDTGAEVTRGLWNGEDDITFSIRSGFTGLNEDRTYYGASIKDVGEIVSGIDLNVPSVDVTLPIMNDVTEQLLREYNARLASVEIHTLYLAPNTGMPVGTLLDFVGEVDKAPIKTPEAGGEGSIVIKVVSDIMSMLTRINGRKSSHEDQAKYGDGDQINKYASTVARWPIPWGQKRT
ncbi:UNVERIFIED_ORG: hypothetical protein LHK14_18050 [Roseateles sp. XES5]|nr:hypothetical protein [Roseateles sp. XES5]